MKALNLRKLKNAVLAVLFAVAVMFVMPAAVFADNTIGDNEFGVDYEGGIDTGLTVAETNDTIENAGLFEEPVVTDTAVCYGACCESCDETCNGNCCDMCIIFKDAEGIVPDNFEGVAGDGFTTDDNLNGDNWLTENGNFGNKDNETPEFSAGLTVPDYTANDFENSYENGNNIVPPILGEPILPNIDVIVPENPEGIYQPEIGNDLTDNSFTEDLGDKIEDNKSEEIIYDDLTDLIGEEEEIIFGDDESDDGEKSDGSETQSPNIDEENTDNSDEPSDNTKYEENPDNSDSEISDNITDEENPDNIDNELSDNTADEENPDNDSEFSDNTKDEEKSDSSDDEISDNAADEEDNSDSEAMEEDENPVINVVLPVSISVMVNPYNLQTVNDNDFHYSILSPEYSIKNYSNCDILISATVSVSTEGGVVISPYDLNGNETEFTAFIYLETTDESNKYSDKYSNNANQLAFSNDTVSKEILTLADGSNGETVGYFRINGQAVLPDNAEYSSQAMLNMVITFDIAPISKAVVSNDVDAVENTENAENVENVESVNNIENVQELAA